MTWEMEIETAIVDRLKIALAPLPVEALPDKPWNFTHPRGAALVVFTGADPAEGVDLYTSAQPVTLSYEVVLLSRSLRDNAGLYPMLEAARKALLGWRPEDSGLTPFRMGRVTNQGYEDSAWRMSLILTTQAMWVDDAEPTIGPLLKELTFEEI
ncbi:hypothetical protein COW36_09035 [bacterium (Candidatus Blackallbacteria) CG17_big_fil_post_rev_8_21_14_2_50_48_46]|uniref:Uncharacterized protein n=1 Tax=bacterium (Candidatus Blackallbacteria) CG17_big_fil_post_rev_8_21_14_2_50_48_46 TaxID=2014261 RepID=A0A2M7G5W9_9BACT|nr:MAG: hypothetical protein COW64_24015 [bacterium (Candidatus Blackallbacteria) CG18_big_fil_WC_8_21_14_2_50_49_26]PIW17312.1 MAG: hypothetical protein COW36_09035 [bacterium (Candidatus Blackallbacteria) CG17_big_fil_post_rev_8_21_14_2_50_48_46]PIW47457.1 MAG: hypothetical protein COW20_12795 [bacterium (Candidatus Blackallbacteria) CG13_big_fil_rev_8_21_14_2_50_49_14]